MGEKLSLCITVNAGHITINKFTVHLLNNIVRTTTLRECAAEVNGGPYEEESATHTLS